MKDLVTALNLIYLLLQIVVNWWWNKSINLYFFIQIVTIFSMYQTNMYLTLYGLFCEWLRMMNVCGGLAPYCFVQLNTYYNYLSDDFEAWISRLSYCSSNNNYCQTSSTRNCIDLIKHLLSSSLVSRGANRIHHRCTWKEKYNVATVQLYLFIRMRTRNLCSKHH